MLKNYKYTDKELKALLDSMVVLVDTREKTSHITKYFDKKGIAWKSKKLNYGDYSAMIPKNEALGVNRDLYFTKNIVIEKKGSLEEISGNLTKGRDRLEKEFALAPKTKVLLIENAGFEDIVNNNYRTEYNRKSFLGSLFSFWFKYDMPVFFINDSDYTAIFIKLYLEYYIRNYVLY